MIAVVLSFLMTFSSLAFGAPKTPTDWNQARLVPSETPDERIDGLTWSNAPLEVVARVEGGVFQPFVRLRGTLAGIPLKEGWLLFQGEEEIPVKQGRFEVSIPLLGEVTPVRLYALTPLGEIKNEKAVLIFSGWEAFGQTLRQQLNPKEAIYLGVGLAKVQYAQTRTKGFAGTFMTVKTSFQSTLRAPYLDYGFTGFLTGLPLSINRDGLSVKFIGLNARLGYALPAVREPWRLSLLGGGYFTTMLAPLGYNQVAGPMLYPILRRALSDRDQASGYVKYSPISDGMRFMPLRNREFAVGVAWKRNIPNWNPMSLSLDFADLSMTTGTITAHSKVISVSLSLGL